MKLMLCVASLQHLKPALGQLGIQPVVHHAHSFIYLTEILHHQVDIIETGVGAYQTAYKVTKALTQQKYHLALKLGFGNAYKEEIPAGAVLNIINEKPGDVGMMVNGEWKDVYDLNLVSRDSPPHVRGGLVNMTNAYMNVFMPYKKSVGVSVNHYADKTAYAWRKEKYRADVETGDGIGFAYPCLFEQQTFYHLCVVERNMLTGAEDFASAAQVMNETFVDLIHKL